MTGRWATVADGQQPVPPSVHLVLRPKDAPDAGKDVFQRTRERLIEIVAEDRPGLLHDLASARKLNAVVHQHFQEDQVFAASRNSSKSFSRVQAHAINRC